MSFVILYLWMFVLILPHELGHATAARLLRFRVISVNFGYGRRLFETNVFSLPLRFNLLPFGGTTVALPQSRRLVRLRMWLYVAAGPATHLVAVAACYFALGEREFFDRVTGGNLILGVDFLQAFVYANVLLLVINLYPMKLDGAAGGLYNDGYYLGKIPFLKREEFAAYELELVSVEAQELLCDGQVAAAIEKYEDALRRHPDKYVLRHNVATAYLADGQIERAREIFTSLLDCVEFEMRERRVVLGNNIAWTIAVLNDAESFERAEYYSAHAVKFAPQFPVFQGTRGAVLIRIGKIAEGVELLKTAFRHHSEAPPRAAVAAFLALGEALRGNETAALKHLTKARQIFPTLYLLDRLEGEVRAALEIRHAPAGESSALKSETPALPAKS